MALVANELNLSYIQKTIRVKNLIYLIFPILALFDLSCQPDKCCVLPPPVVISAEKNGVVWQLPVIKSTVDSHNTVFISTVGPYLLNTAKDSLAIDMQFNGLGNYKPTAGQITYTVFSNGTKTAYLLDTTFNNTISIIEYQALHNPATTNPDPTELKATFNLRFVDPMHTTSVSLLNGKFTVYLSNSN